LLSSSKEFKNLSLQQKNLIRKNFDDINKRIKVYQKIKQDDFTSSIKSYSENSKRATGYLETSSVIEKTRHDRASLEGAKKKAWRSVLDTRTRPVHAKADGQVVNIEDYFLIANPSGGGVDKLRFPGDIFAPLNQIIGCRCTVLYLD
jgi:hypothetical protein